MKHILTRHTQINKKCKDGKSRSYILWFVNNVLILKQKFPYDEKWEKGFDHKTSIYDVYVLNGKIHQTRKTYKGYKWNEELKKSILIESKERIVSFPLSKKKLNQLGILPDVKITEL
jgi:hypothetical protein